MEGIFGKSQKVSHMSRGVRGPFLAEMPAIATKHEIKDGEINVYEHNIVKYMHTNLLHRMIKETSMMLLVNY